MTITIELPDDKTKALAAQANELGLTVENYVARLVLERSAQTNRNAAFHEAAEYVLKKDAELLKRLA